MMDENTEVKGRAMKEFTVTYLNFYWAVIIKVPNASTLNSIKFYRAGGRNANAIGM